MVVVAGSVGSAVGSSLAWVGIRSLPIVIDGKLLTCGNGGGTGGG